MSLFCLYFVSLSGYHAEGYHVSSLPPRAITPVYTSRLPHQSYHAPPIHVHRVITPAISYSYFVVLSFAGFYATCASPPTPPLGATRYNLLNTAHKEIHLFVLLCSFSRVSNSGPAAQVLQTTPFINAFLYSVGLRGRYTN